MKQIETPYSFTIDPEGRHREPLIRIEVGQILELAVVKAFALGLTIEDLQRIQNACVLNVVQKLKGAELAQAKLAGEPIAEESPVVEPTPTEKPPKKTRSRRGKTKGAEDAD